MIEIDTYLKIEDNFVNIKEISLIDTVKDNVDIDYLEGAIIIKYWSTEVTGIKEWDYVDQLWNYYIKAIGECIRTGESTFCFPDQPLRVSMKLNHNDSCVFSVNFGAEEKKTYFDSFKDLAKEMLNSYLDFCKVTGTIFNYSNNIHQDYKSIIENFISRYI